ncbi:unnamed protein product [Owenia fusiformis]|uniref:Uncharacterized protein n=1 Tax=Owenia fusiformis TaxID=6347 RepID=A0A8S4NYU7_OWEFU|nr:unnamed protein product [Owenia fusiformis]
MITITESLKLHINNTNSSSEGKKSRFLVFGDNPLLAEEIEVKEHYKQLLNRRKKYTITKQVYIGLEFQNICAVHSEELILSQVKQMYKLAGLKIHQQFNNESLRFLSQDLFGPCLYYPTRYAYSIEWTHDKLHHNVYMKISETFLNKPTYGGSSFRIHVQGVHSFLCHVKDNFNGIYHVCCPYVPPCSTITVTLMYMSYGAFLDVPTIQPVSLILAQIQNCDLHHREQQSYEQFEMAMIENVQCDRQPKVISKYGRWIFKDGVLRWGLHSKCLTEMMDPKALRNCFKKLKNIGCYGDSHLRYTMTYFGSFIKNDFVFQMWEDWGFDHFTFNWCPGLPVVWKSLIKNYIFTLKNSTRFQSQAKDQRKSTILINNGSWDLDRGLFSNYLYSIKSLLVPLIKIYRKNPIWDTTPIIWLSNAAFPHEYRFIFDHGGHHKRNDFRAAAANSLIESLTKDLKVEFINQLTPSSIRSSDNVCSAHYICQKDVSGPEKARGDVGIVIAHMLFDEMCK